MQTHFFQGLSEWQKDCLLFFWAKDLLVEEEMEKGPPARYFRTASIAY